jgi:hypothetical protein
LNQKKTQKKEQRNYSGTDEKELSAEEGKEPTLSSVNYQACWASWQDFCHIILPNHLIKDH